MRRMLTALATAVLVAGAVTVGCASSDGDGDRSDDDSPTARPSESRATLTAGTRAAGRPNFLYVIVDDMRQDDLKYMPQTRKLIGGRGVRFVNSFAPYPLCCPARSSILTGRYTHNHEVYSVKKEYGFHALDDRRTIATLLRNDGYHTVYLGKYLNRYGIDPPPRRTSGNSVQYVPPGWSDWRASIDGGLPSWHPAFGGTYNYTNTTLNKNGNGYQNFRGRYQTTAYGELAERIIRARAKRSAPWFFHLSFTAPHHGKPRESDDPPATLLPNGKRFEWNTPARPERVWGRFDDRISEAPGADWRDPDISDKPNYIKRRPAPNRAAKRAMLEVTRQRAESLWVVDRQVRRLVRALRDTGQLDETVVVFTSDNGELLGEQRNLQGKIWPHEASLRVPLLMRGPGIPAGEVRRDPITSLDIMATFADAAGVTPYANDGVSLWGVARNGDKGWSRAILTETDNMGHRARDTDLAGEPREDGEPRDIRFLIGIRTARYLYVDVEGQKDELYDLREDPEQYRNLVGIPEYADIRALLAAELKRMRACKGDVCRAAMAPELVVPAP